MDFEYSVLGRNPNGILRQDWECGEKGGLSPRGFPLGRRED